MFRFILKAVLFLVPILAVFAVIEIGTRLIPNDYSFKFAWMDQNAEDLEVLVLGNSHAYRGIDPEYLSLKAFNAANVSQTLDYDQLIFDFYRPRMKNLKCVVINISYQSLFNVLSESAENWREKNYWIYSDIMVQPPAIKHRIELATGRTSDKIKRLLRFATNNGTDVASAPFGFDGVDEVQSDLELEESAEAVVDRHTQSDFKNLSGHIERLKTIIDDCEQDGIRVLLVTLPVSAHYRSHISARQWDTTTQTCMMLSRDYGNVTYHSFFADDAFEQNDFKDVDHLNAAGAKKLTRMLDKLILDLVNAESVNLPE